MQRIPLIAPAVRGLSRREVLRRLFLSAGALGSARLLTACDNTLTPAESGSTEGTGAGRFANIGPLSATPDDLGFRLPTSPPGFSVRIVAESLQPPLGSKPSFLWPIFPDGSGILPTDGGGWIYVVNSEVPGVGTLANESFIPQASPVTSPIQTFAPGLGGANCLKFNQDAQLVDAYNILSGTTFNCAGVITPWKTWLSCEETNVGQVWECDPQGQNEAVVRPALGRFDHEAVAIDMNKRMLYLTEDLGDSRFYRFVPTAADWPAGAERPALQAGVLQVMKIVGSGDPLSGPQPVTWVDAQNPTAAQNVNRVPDTAIFDGTEGVWYFQGFVYFSTKGDNRIWVYDSVGETLEVIYDFGTAQAPNNILSGVDNLYITSQGDVLVAEDGGDMQIVVILPDRRLKPLLQLTGQDGSELAGIAFSPDGRRMYFNSDRGGIFPNLPNAPGHGPGITYELTLPEGL